MKLLIVTQKIDKIDDNLGFFHRWVEEFAKHATEIKVIAGYVGQIDLPINVQIFSLGKEKRRNKIYRIFNFWKLLFKNYDKADAIFFHMAPEFVLAAVPWVLFGKSKSSLWYTHKSVTWKLQLAEKLVNIIFTASRLSFRLPSKKVMYTGHAIDTEFFKPGADQRTKNSNIKIITVGRLSPSKDYETIIQACSDLKERGIGFNYSIVGAPVAPKDQKYVSNLQRLVHKLGLQGVINFMGPISYLNMPLVYNQYDIFISTSSTGSIDKAILEAMSCGLTVITTNEAFREVLPDKYFLSEKTPKNISEKILELALESRPNNLLRSLVINKHSLDSTIKSICALLS